MEEPESVDSGFFLFGGWRAVFWRVRSIVEGGRDCHVADSSQ